MYNKYMGKGKIKEILMRMMRPHFLIILWLAIFSAAALIYVFSNGMEKTAIAYIAYPVSAYTLTVAVIACTDAVKSSKNSTIVQRALNRPIVNRYLNDTVFRGEVALYFSLAINLIYVIFKLTMGIMYDSLWFVALAAYYAVLSIMRVRLVKAVRKDDEQETAREKIICELKEYRNIGFLMLLLNAAMFGVIYQVISNDMGYEYPGYIIYVTAVYVFYMLVKASVNLLKHRRLNNPLLSASKFITFAGALMSMLALQTAMLFRFGADNVAFRRLMNALSGSVVLIVIIASAVYMIATANYQLKKRRNRKRRNRR